MTSFHFGDTDAPLVGVYHRPAVRAPGVPAVLLCNPFGAAFNDFDLRGHVTVEVRPEIDHTYSTMGPQSILIDRVTSWVDEGYSAMPSNLITQVTAR